MNWYTQFNPPRDIAGKRKELMNATQTWLPTKEQLDAYRADWLSGYAMSPDGNLFQPVYGIGYWAYGVEFDAARGWLLFEFQEDESDEYAEDMDHSAAIAAWKAMDALPKNYFALYPDKCEEAFKIGVRKWGERFMDDMDLPRADELIQAALFGEPKYG